MGIRSFLSKPFANYVVKKQQKWMKNPEQAQQAIFENQLKVGRQTQIGVDHQLNDVGSHAEFVEAMPVRDYEGLQPYVQQVIDGASDVMWRGRPAYFAKTSGTTSGVKYIPITKDSIPNHMDSARNALLNYVHESGNGDFLDGKLMFLSGSPELEYTNGIPTGRLSGIVNHHVPKYLRTNQKPSYQTNCIEDWKRN